MAKVSLRLELETARAEQAFHLSDDQMHATDFESGLFQIFKSIIYSWLEHQRVKVSSKPMIYSHPLVIAQTIMWPQTFGTPIPMTYFPTLHDLVFWRLWVKIYAEANDDDADDNVFAKSSEDA